MLECLKKLVDLGNNGSDEMNNNCLSLEKVGELTEGHSCYYQEYKVSSNIEMSSYSLHNLKNFPKGSYVANTQNVYQGGFKLNENFRILIPKDKFVENISGQIEIRGVCKNYPIFYGEAPSGKQDYVLTYDSYGDVTSLFDINLDINTAKVIIVKKDSDTGNRLDGVKFELISKDNKYRYEGITNSNGEIYFENLYPGKYILREIETLNEYEICKDEFEIEIKYYSVEKIEIFNKLKKGNLKVIKVCEDNVDMKLSGVEFELYNEQMELLESLVTDKNGEAISKFYPSENQKYFLKEVKTLDGYILNDELIEINLENGKTIEYIIKNEKIYIPEEPEPEEIIPEEPELEEIIPEEPELEEIIPEEPELEEIIPEEPEPEEVIPEEPEPEEIILEESELEEDIPEKVEIPREVELPKLPKTGM